MVWRQRKLGSVASLLLSKHVSKNNFLHYYLEAHSLKERERERERERDSFSFLSIYPSFNSSWYQQGLCHLYCCLLSSNRSNSYLDGQLLGWLSGSYDS